MNPGEHLLIDFCDHDKNWGFLLFLRPARHEPIGFARAFAAAVLLGLPLGLFGSIVLGLIARGLDKAPPGVLWFPAVLTGVYFIAAQITLFRAWNRRALRLARSR